MASILVIDDDEGVCQMVQTLLSGKGHEVDGAPDGHEGIVRYREHPADLVITDLFMPEKDGLETIRVLREVQPDLKVIAITGYDPDQQHGYLELAGDLGATRTFSKPFDTKEFVAAIQELLDG